MFSSDLEAREFLTESPEQDPPQCLPQDPAPEQQGGGSQLHVFPSSAWVAATPVHSLQFVVSCSLPSLGGFLSYGNSKGRRAGGSEGQIGTGLGIRDDSFSQSRQWCQWVEQRWHWGGQRCGLLPTWLWADSRRSKMPATPRCSHKVVGASQPLIPTQMISYSPLRCSYTNPSSTPIHSLKVGLTRPHIFYCIFLGTKPQTPVCWKQAWTVLTALEPLIYWVRLHLYSWLTSLLWLQECKYSAIFPSLFCLLLCKVVNYTHSLNSLSLRSICTNHL